MIQIDRDELIETIAALVRIPSINPSLVPGAGGEREVAEAIAARLRRTPGIDVELQDAGDGRPNVIATVGDGPGRTLMINGHIDTVGVAGMDDPFSGRVEGNLLYGRGSDDMKASVAGVILLLESVARSGNFPGKLVATFVVDEEHSSIGTQAICRDIDRWQPDAALVAEPTGLGVNVAHKGFVWAAITTHGFAAHGSDFRRGRDAIAQMGGVIVAFDAYARSLVSRLPHSIVGPPSAHCSLIRGGQELSSYPDGCTLEIERRTIPGESGEQVERELTDILSQIAPADGSFRADLNIGLIREPFEIATDATIVQCLSSAVRSELGEEPRIGGGAGWMDSALLSAAGVPTVIFGPDGDGGHGLLERSDIRSVEMFTRVLARTAYEFCASR
jgi:acetylornithine deacetylase